MPIYRAVEVDGLAYFVMAFVDGISLEEHLETRLVAHSDARDVVRDAETIRMLRDAALALDHAHAAGVVHRDVKPANILLERRTGRVLLTDFGIAHAVTGEHVSLT